MGVDSHFVVTIRFALIGEMSQNCKLRYFIFNSVDASVYKQIHGCRFGFQFETGITYPVFTNSVHGADAARGLRESTTIGHRESVNLQGTLHRSNSAAEIAALNVTAI